MVLVCYVLSYDHVIQINDDVEGVIEVVEGDVEGNLGDGQHE
jgi:hypothetical protein